MSVVGIEEETQKCFCPVFRSSPHLFIVPCCLPFLNTCFLPFLIRFCAFSLELCLLSLLFTFRSRSMDIFFYKTLLSLVVL